MYESKWLHDSYPGGYLEQQVVTICTCCQSKYPKTSQDQHSQHSKIETQINLQTTIQLLIFRSYTSFLSLLTSFLDL